jgi:hypothetical protein
VLKKIFGCLLLAAIGAANAAAPSYHVVPIKLKDRLPVVPLTVEGHRLELVLDTGDRDGVVLRQKVLDRLNHVHYTGHTRHAIDVLGKRISAREYRLRNVEIGGRKFTHMSGSVYHPWGLRVANCSSGERCTPDRHGARQGMLGLDAVDHGGLILDYPHRRIVLIKGSADPPGYDMHNWVKTLFKSNANGISFTVRINHQPVRLVLDTGATMSMFKKSSLSAIHYLAPCQIHFPDGEPCQLYTPPQPVLFGRRLAAVKFYVFPYRYPAGDAVVGYNFLVHNIIYLDFTSHLMAIKPVKHAMTAENR